MSFFVFGFERHKRVWVPREVMMGASLPFLCDSVRDFTNPLAVLSCGTNKPRVSEVRFLGFCAFNVCLFVCLFVCLLAYSES